MEKFNQHQQARRLRQHRSSLRIIFLPMVASFFLVGQNALFSIASRRILNENEDPSRIIIVDTMKKKERNDSLIKHRHHHEQQQTIISQANFKFHTTGPKIDVEKVVEREIIKDNKNKDDPVPIKQKNMSRISKTRAVIHMGIHKTGSTAIQKQSALHARELKLDRYEMPWRLIAEGSYNPSKQLLLKKDEMRANSNQVNFATCFLPPSNRVKHLYPCDEGLLSAGIEISKRRKNLLVSAETFSEIQTDGAAKLSKYLSQHWDDVTIIVYHRRFYSWIASVYNQLFKNNEHVLQGKRAKTTIIDFVTDSMSLPMSMSGQNMKYSYFLLDRINKYFGNNIVIMDYHDRSKGGSDKAFFCHALPNATHTCDNVKEMKRNSAKSFDYEDLAYAAKMAGLINLNDADDLRTAVDAIEQQHRKNLRIKKLSVFKRICPSSDVLDKVWEFSLKVEKNIFPDRFIDGSSYQTTMRSDFEQIATTTLCKLDVDSILREDTWKTFFENFERKRLSYKKMFQAKRHTKQVRIS